MSYTDFHVRYEPVQDLMDRRQFLNLVVDEKQLAAAVEFIVYDAPDLILVERMISVWVGILFGGGVLMMDKSLAPSKENCKVRGIGVAVRVSVSTEALT